MDNILFLVSFVMLFFGGELLVRSSVALALRMRISTLVVGMTVVSFVTSSPELFVSIASPDLPWHSPGDSTWTTSVPCT